MLVRNNLKNRFILFLVLCVAVVCFSVSTLRGFRAGEVILQRNLLPLTEASIVQHGNASHPDPSIERIPRIIHQIYKNKTIPEKWSEAHRSCREQNPPGNWTHFLWTDEKGRDFIRSFYSWFLPIYDSYPYNVQRFDALRYLLLHHYGGIYLDLDVGCKKDLSPLLKYPAFFGKTTPYGVSNDVMGSEKGHELFRQLVLSLERNNYYRGTKYPTVMMSTGPMFVTRVLVDFLRAKSHNTTAEVSEDVRDLPVAILPPELYGMSPVSYFEHYPGSSWHGWDVWVLSNISNRPILFLSSGLLTLVGISYLVRRRRRIVV
ncbi:hypothetical protein MANI_024160 [Metarhizium anisopliae]|nr:hypothetical protein MANI_024160 [Metarhizium anisopliae]